MERPDQEKGLIYTYDYSNGKPNGFWNFDTFATVEDGVLVIKNETERANNWDLQFAFANGVKTYAGNTYKIRVTMKANGEGYANLATGMWGTTNMDGNLNFTATEDFVANEMTYTKPEDAGIQSAHILWQSGKFVGTVWIKKVEVFEIPEEVVIIPDESDPGVKPVPEGWKSLITNGTLTEDNVTSFAIKNEEDSNGGTPAVRVADAGRYNGAGIKVVSKNNAGTDWGTQFFILSSEPLVEGAKLHVEFDYRADTKTFAPLQAHREPGNYNANMDVDIEFSQNWKHFEKDFEINENQGKNGGMLSLGLNLSLLKESHEFYFDNIVLWTLEDPLFAFKKDLEAAIALGNAQNSFAKTTESFGVLTSAIEAAETALADKDATEESLTAAKTAITDAIAGFKLQDGYTNLTSDMFKHWNDNNTPTTSSSTGCAYDLNISTGMPYGDSNVHYLNFADVSDFNKLFVLINAGQARVQMNRLADPENKGVTKIFTKGDAVSSVDFATDLADFDFAHINAIKDNWGKVTVSGMYLYRTFTVSSDAGMASFGTLYKTANLNGADAVYGAKFEGDGVKLIPVDSKNVPAGVGVLVEGSDEIVPKFDVEATAIDGNELKVSNGTVSGEGIYVLANKDKGLGFYKLAPDAKVPAGKAYLQVANGSREYIAIDGGATAIKSVETENANGAIYNLAGQQVKNAQKGIFIMNGKKVIK